MLRAGVERVMGFCSDDEYRRFIRQAPLFERMLVDDGVNVLKFWFSVSQGEQRTRFTIRRIDPVRQWKLSPMDLASLDRWDDCTAAEVAMVRETDTQFAPWTVVKSNDKKRARVEAMRSVLARFDYTDKDDEAVGCPDPRIVGAAAGLLEAGEDQKRYQGGPGARAHGERPRLSTRTQAGGGTRLWLGRCGSPMMRTNRVERGAHGS